MNAWKNRNWNAKRMFIMASICLPLLLVFSDGSAQTLTATPGSVETANPQPVVLHVTKTDGTNDSDLIKKVRTVKVSGQRPNFHKDADAITITPPKLASGMQPLQLLDDQNNTIVTGELRYQVAGSDGGSGLSMQELTFLRQEARRDQLVKSYWYYGIVTGIFLFVLGIFVLAVYRGTSGSTSTGNRPLGLPVGSFRAILAYSLVVYLGFYVLTSILSVSQFAPSDFLLGIVATVIGFYFGSRSGDEGEASQKTGSVRGIVRRDANHPAQGAMVKFKRSADGTEPYSRISDLDGRFELRGAAPGKYKVKASLTGASPSDEQEISVAEGSDHEVEIVLKSAVPASPSPATSGTVQGTVTNPDGSPASGAKVVFTQGGVQKHTTTTDAAGNYNAIVAAGGYDVEASLAALKSAKETVTVTAGGPQTVALRLS